MAVNWVMGQNGRLTIAAGAVFTLLAGLVLSAWAFRQTDQDMRRALLQQARLAVEAVSTAEIVALEGNESDLQRQEYLRLKAQLSRIRRSNSQCRFVYLLGMRPEGEVYIIADSEPVDSQDYSPPGQTYAKVSISEFKAFQQSVPSVSGPVTDRWGTWFSALAPLMHPETGRMLAVLGMDMDATTWALDLAARVVVPVGSTLIVLIAAVSLLAASTRAKQSPKPVTQRLMPPLAALLAVLLAGFGAALRVQYQSGMNERINAFNAEISGEFQAEIERTTASLMETAQAIASDARVMEALRIEDAVRLMNDWKTTFDALRRESELTHFSFLNGNQTCVLRLHEPAQRSDSIQRFTTLEAVRTGKITSGMEIGDTGTLVLRVVCPVFQQEALIGYVELGKDLENLLENLYVGKENQVALILRKECMERPQWEAKRQQLGRPSDWNRLPHSLVLYASQGFLPDPFALTADSMLAARQTLGQKPTEIHHDGKTWRAAMIPLADASGKEVGGFLVMLDATMAKESFRQLTIFSGIFFAVLLVGLLGFLFVLLRRMDASIRLQQVELREKTEFNQLLFDASPALIVAINTDGRTVMMNEAMLTLLEYAPEEIEGLNYLESFIPQDDRPLLQDLFNKALSDKAPSINENHIISKSGRQYLIEWHGRLVSALASGEDVFIGVGIDISSRRAAEEALRVKTEELERYFNFSLDLLCVAGLSGRFLRLNPEWENTLGYTLSELENKYFLDLVHPEDREQTERAIARLAGQETILNFENRYRHKDGSYRWIEWRSVPRGNLIYAAARDITERKRAADEVRLERDRMEFIIAGARLGTWEWNVHTNKTVFNEIWAALLGYSLKELLPCNYATWERFVHPDDLEEARRRLMQCVEGKSPSYDCAYRMRHKDGHWVWILDRGRIMTRDADGHPLLMFGTHADITERKQAEVALKESEERLDLALAAVNDGLWDWNIAQNQVYFDTRYYTLAGYEPNEFPQDFAEWVRRVHPEDIVRCQEAIQAHLAGTVAQFDIEFRFLRKDGTYMWINGRGKTVARDAHGAVTRMIGTHTDITARKQTEDALLLFKQSLDNATDAIGMATPQGVHYYQNKVFSQLFGEIGQYPPDTLYVDKAVGEEVFRSIMAGRPWMGEVKMYSKDRSIVDIFLRAYANQNIHGQVTALVGIHMDITERKRAEAALYESELRFSIAFAANPAPLVLSEIDTGRFLDVNNRWMEMLEFTREDLIGKTSTEVGIWQNPADRDRVTQKLRDHGGFKDEPIGFLTKTGKKIAALWSGETIALSGKKVMLSMITDVTERTRAEEKREKLREQLTQAQKMESVGRLAGGVAHDFNNMLGVILGHVELVLDQLPDSSPLCADLEEVRNAADRSADLTRQLLAFARKQTVAPKVISLNETVEGMLKMLRRLIGEDVELAWLPGHGAGLVKMDPSQIDQLLANLCVNARDAIAGVGKIVIETGAADVDADYCRNHVNALPGAYVSLSVRDNGCGMDAETLSHVFEPFFTTKKLGKGTGLGLATVYGIVKQNNGWVDVLSEPGQGTEFKIYLPRHVVDVTPLQTGAQRQNGAKPHETILLVEDEPGILKMATVMLERQGYSVIAAATPGEALRLAKEHAGDLHLLMTDVVMPEMNGRDLARNVLALYPNIKRLFMSGYTADVIAHHGVLDEGVFFIQKPFSMKDLAAKVRDALERG